MLFLLLKISLIELLGTSSHPSQINLHYSRHKDPEMTIERLQKVATANVDNDLKTKWLKWWNDSKEFRRSVRFLEPNDMKDKALENWLAQAVLWAQVLQLLPNCRHLHMLSE